MEEEKEEIRDDVISMNSSSSAGGSVHMSDGSHGEMSAGQVDENIPQSIPDEFPW